MAKKSIEEDSAERAARVRYAEKRDELLKSDDVQRALRELSGFASAQFSHLPEKERPGAIFDLAVAAVAPAADPPQKALKDEARRRSRRFTRELDRLDGAADTLEKAVAVVPGSSGFLEMAGQIRKVVQVNRSTARQGKLWKQLSQHHIAGTFEDGFISRLSPYLPERGRWIHLSSLLSAGCELRRFMWDRSAPEVPCQCHSPEALRGKAERRANAQSR